MKRLFAAVLALILLLCGCGVIKENDERGECVPTSEMDPLDNEYHGRVEKSALYFLNETSGTLTAELRTLVIEQDTNPAEVAIEELLRGPSNEDLAGVAPEGMSLDFIEFSRDIANVYLIYSGQGIAAKRKFILELALANTITDILGATYICVFYNGIYTGFSGIASAPLKKQTGNIEDAWLQAQAKYLPEVHTAADEITNEEPSLPLQTAEADQALLTEEELAQAAQEPKISEITTILYFVSAGGGYILPEVRNVKYTEQDYISSLFEELKKGPQDTSVMKSPLAYDLEIIQEPEQTDIGEGYRLTLDFSGLPTDDFSDEEDSILSFAAIIYTITGFVPEIQSIDLLVQGKRITTVDGLTGFYDGMHRQDYIGYIGSSAPIYFADKDSDLLLEVLRSMEQEKIWSAKERTKEIIEGPLSGDGENAWPVMPSGVSALDIMSVDVYEDTAYVNLSQNFKDACAGFSSKNEMLLIYSIVNTITALDGINKVQFLVESKQTKALAGHLWLTDPFLKNYGIIKKSG